MSKRKSRDVDAQLADACWRAQVVEEKAAEAATAARAEAVEAHKVLRTAVAAHAAEVASQKQREFKPWIDSVKARMDAVVARHIQKMEDEMAAE